MKILIIGAKGMLGTDLGKALSSHELILWDRTEIDITQEEQVKEKALTLKPNLIINAAAYTAVDKCEEPDQFEMAKKVNGEALKYLAQTCKKLDIPLVHYSTDYIFNGNKKDGYVEDFNEVEPLNKYGESKALGEKNIQDNTDKYYIIRIQWLYGKNGPNFVDTMLKLFNEKNELKIINDQHGCPTYTKDVAQATKEIIESKNPFGIYHVCNEGITTWYDYALEIFKIARSWTPNEPGNKNIQPVPTEEFPTPAKRPRYSPLVNTKLTPLRPWQEALKDYLNS